MIAPSAAAGEAPKEHPKPVAKAVGTAATAYASLDRWLNILVSQVLEQPVGRIEPPAPFTAESYAVFTGWRWVFHHFRSLRKEVVEIAASWWMDNVWSQKERGDVLLDLATTKTSDQNQVQRLVYSELHGKELYTDSIRGYLQYNPASDLVTQYCINDETGAPEECASNLTEFIEAEIGTSPDLEAGTLPVYGFLTLKNGTVIFKTLNKSTGDTRGAECATSANLDPHILRVQLIQAQIRSMTPDPELLSLLLDDSNATKPGIEEKKARQDAVKERYDPPKKSKLADPSVDVIHVAGLSLKQICPYTEFLLRWHDRILARTGSSSSSSSSSSGASAKKPNHPRAFLSLIDTVRATAAAKAVAEAAKKPRAAGKAVKAKPTASAKK
jgi:hypothetical protein